MHMICKLTNMNPNEFIYNIGDAHIYEEHISDLLIQIDRKPYQFPKLILNKRNDIDKFIMDDFKISNYKYYPHIKMDMII